MVKLIANNGKPVYGVCEYACDSPDDIKELPSCEMGSTCIIISTGELYMMNSNNEWVKI